MIAGAQYIHVHLDLPTGALEPIDIKILCMIL